MKQKLILLLNELADLESNQFKSRAYKRAANTLNGVDESILKNLDDFTYLYGIGTGINSKILEFRETGVIAKIQELREENQGYLNPRNYKIRKTFVTKKITYFEATKLLNKLATLYDKFTVAGSYRRCKDLIGDLDILVPEEDYQEVLDKLANKYEVITYGSCKSSFMIDELNRVPLDVISTKKNELPFQLLYLTGSKEFNINMRAHAKSLGYKLNQYGIFDSNEDQIEEITKEEDIFKFLNYPYLEPNER